MHALILAAEAAGDPSGDDFQVIAWILAGVVLLITGIAAAIVTPRADHH